MGRCILRLCACVYRWQWVDVNPSQSERGAPKAGETCWSRGTRQLPILTSFYSSLCAAVRILRTKNHIICSSIRMLCAPCAVAFFFSSLWLLVRVHTSKRRIWSTAHAAGADTMPYAYYARMSPSNPEHNPKHWGKWYENTPFLTMLIRTYNYVVCGVN